IGLPTWMWVTQPGPHTWGPITRTATAGGITVSATGTVDHVDWDMGDGHTVTCTGPGTTYHASAGDADSPTCGYRYPHVSAHQPDGHYTITATATSYWTVHWTGGGQAGTITLQLSDTATLRIGEAEALMTGN
ncbi:MAG: hypothetical protein ACRDQA_16255, partial [Nocardioidaceae bacterium]